MILSIRDNDNLYILFICSNVLYYTCAEGIADGYLVSDKRGDELTAPVLQFVALVFIPINSDINGYDL